MIGRNSEQEAITPGLALHYIKKIYFYGSAKKKIIVPDRWIFILFT